MANIDKTFSGKCYKCGRDDWSYGPAYCFRCGQELQGEIKKLAAENAELRETLEQIYRLSCVDSNGFKPLPAQPPTSAADNESEAE